LTHTTYTYQFTQSEVDSTTTEDTKENTFSQSHTFNFGVATEQEVAKKKSGGHFDYTLTVMNSDTKRNSVIKAISDTLTHSETYLHAAYLPDHLTGHYTLWAWNVFRPNNIGGWGNLVTFASVFKWGPCRDVPPNCIPGTCADDACMTCTTPEAVIDPDFTGVREACLPRPRRCSEMRINYRDWHCCTSQEPCRIGEGDCDDDNQCEGDLICLEDTHARGFDTCGYGPDRRSLKVVHRRLIEKEYA